MRYTVPSLDALCMSCPHRDSGMRRLPRTLLLISMLTLGAGSVTWADEVYLKDGTRLIGKVVSMEDGDLKVESPSINDEAELTIDWENVVRIVSEQPLRLDIVVRDDLAEHQIPETGRIEVTTLEDTERLPLNRVYAINRPKIRYKASLDLGGNSTSGNTQTSAFNVTSQVNVWTPHHLFLLEAKVNTASADGAQTAQNARGILGYLYKFTDRWAAGPLTLLEHDDFQDLRIRDSPGLLVAYKPLNRATHELLLGIGPAFVYQDFNLNPA